MQFILIPIGLMMMITGIRDTHVQFGAQLRTDLTGDKNFIQYALALGFVGALGYINDLRTASNTFMALIIISMLLSNRGFFQKFSEALKAGPATIAPTPSGQAAAASSLPSIISPIPGMPGAGAAGGGTPEGNWLGNKLGLPTWLVPLL